MFSFVSRSSKRIVGPVESQRQRVGERTAAPDSGFDGMAPDSVSTAEPADRFSRSWIDSTLDLKQGLDVVEMADLPEEFFQNP